MAIRRMVETFQQVEPHPFMKCGDWVRVKSGPLEGLEGILIRKKNLCKLILSIEMVGRSAAVEVELSAVERVAKRAASRRLDSSIPAVA